MAGALTPELISAEMWAPPPTFDGAATAAAGALIGVVSQINGILDGQQANVGVLLTAWASPTGEKAISANAPYQAWLTDMATQITAAAHQITTAAADFAAARTATPTPLEFLENWTEFFILVATNILGQNTHLITENRVQYAHLVARTMTAYHTYGSESAATVQTLPPLPAPPLSATPNPSIGAGLAAAQPFGQAMQGSGALRSVGSAAVQPISATAPLVSQLVSQPSNALMTSGGELAQAPPAMTSGLTGLPGLGSQGASAAGLGGTGADTGGWMGATPAWGSTVAAALSGGGAGISGVGGTALAPMRGPVSWASSANLARPAPGPDAGKVVVSRIAEARAASATPATSAGMGAPGAMAPPASASARERGRDGTLAAPAVLYRAPRDMPVVTGAAGTQFVAGEEDQ
jgi:PPE-repeat protein